MFLGYDFFELVKLLKIQRKTALFKCGVSFGGSGWIVIPTALPRVPFTSRPRSLRFEPVVCFANFSLVLISAHPAQNKTIPQGDGLFWWEYACTNRAENKQEFSDLMQQVKEFKEKWLFSPEGEN